MSQALAILLFLVTGFLLALVIMFTSSALLGYYVREAVRRILRSLKRVKR